MCSYPIVASRYCVLHCNLHPIQTDHKTVFYSAFCSVIQNQQILSHKIEVVVRRILVLVIAFAGTVDFAGGEVVAM